jgi:hypothetical protein
MKTISGGEFSRHYTKIIIYMCGLYPIEYDEMKIAKNMLVLIIKKPISLLKYKLFSVLFLNIQEIEMVV